MVLWEFSFLPSLTVTENSFIVPLIFLFHIGCKAIWPPVTVYWSCSPVSLWNVGSYKGKCGRTLLRGRNVVGIPSLFPGLASLIHSRERQTTHVYLPVLFVVVTAVSLHMCTVVRLWFPSHWLPTLKPTVCKAPQSQAALNHIFQPM